MKVYSSYINIDVYAHNRARPLLKVTGASNNVCVDCIVSPLGGDKWLFNNVFVFESFIQEIRSKTLIHPRCKKWYWLKKIEETVALILSK